MYRKMLLSLFELLSWNAQLFLTHDINYQCFTIKAVLLFCHIILITNVSSPFSTSIGHTAVTDEELIQYSLVYQYMLSRRLKIKAAYLLIKTWSQTEEHEFIMKELKYFICFSSFIKHNEVTLRFTQCFSFLLSFLSIEWIWNNIKLGD